jgi:hypothetical protein
VKWEDFKECIHINSFLNAHVVPKDARPQNRPIEENHHESPMASPTCSQGEHEELQELDSKPPIIEEIHSC